jgi:hypothetical protein
MKALSQARGYISETMVIDIEEGVYPGRTLVCYLQSYMALPSQKGKSRLNIGVGSSGLHSVS